MLMKAFLGVTTNTTYLNLTIDRHYKSCSQWSGALKHGGGFSLMTRRYSIILKQTYTWVGWGWRCNLPCTEALRVCLPNFWCGWLCHTGSFQHTENLCQTLRSDGHSGLQTTQQGRGCLYAMLVKHFVMHILYSNNIHAIIHATSNNNRM